MNGRGFRLTVIALFLLIPITIISMIIVLAATNTYVGFHWWPISGFAWVFLFIPLTFLLIMFALLVLAASRPSRWGSYGWMPCGPWMMRMDRYDRFDAESVLEERYARGEITREQFLRMRDDIADNRR